MSKPRIPITVEEIRATKNVRSLQEMCLNLKKNYDEVTSNLRFINSLYIKAKTDLEQKTSTPDNIQAKYAAMENFQRKALFNNQQIAELAAQNPSSTATDEEKIQYYQSKIKNIQQIIKTEQSELEKIAQIQTTDTSPHAKLRRKNEMVTEKPTDSDSSIKSIMKRLQDENSKLKSELDVAAKRIARLEQENEQNKATQNSSSVERKYNVIKDKARKMNAELEEVKRENELLKKQIIVLSRNSASAKRDSDGTRNSRKLSLTPTYLAASSSSSSVNRYTPKTPKNPTIFKDIDENSSRTSSSSVKIPTTPDKDLQILQHKVTKSIRDSSSLDENSSKYAEATKLMINTKKKELADAISEKEAAEERNKAAKAEFEQKKAEYDREIAAVNQRREKIRLSTEKFEKQINEVSEEIKRLRAMNIDGKKSLEQVERTIRDGTEKINRRRNSLLVQVNMQKEKLASREKELQKVQEELNHIDDEPQESKITPSPLSVDPPKKEPKRFPPLPPRSKSESHNYSAQQQQVAEAHNTDDLNKSTDKDKTELNASNIDEDDDFSDLKPISKPTKPTFQIPSNNNTNKPQTNEKSQNDSNTKQNTPKTSTEKPKLPPPDDDDDDFSDLKPINKSNQPTLQITPKQNQQKPSLHPPDDDDDFSDLKPINKPPQQTIQINQNKSRVLLPPDDDDDDFSDLKPINKQNQPTLQISPEKDTEKPKLPLQDDDDDFSDLKPKNSPQKATLKLNNDDDDDDFSDLKPANKQTQPTLQIKPKATIEKPNTDENNTSKNLPPPDDSDFDNFDALEPVQESSNTSRRVSMADEELDFDDDEFADLKPINVVPPILSLKPEPKAEPKTLQVNLEHEVPKPQAKPGLAKYVADDDNIDNIMEDENIDADELKIQPTTPSSKLPLYKMFIDSDEDNSQPSGDVPLRPVIGSFAARRTMPAGMMAIKKPLRKLPPPDSDEFDNFDNLEPMDSSQDRLKIARNSSTPTLSEIEMDDEFSDLKPIKSRPAPLQLSPGNDKTGKELIKLGEKENIDDLFRSYEGDLVIKVSPKKANFQVGTLQRQHGSAKKGDDAVSIADIIEKVPEEMRKGPQTPITFDDQHSFDYSKFVGDVKTHNDEMKHAKFGLPQDPLSNEEIATEFAGI
ncbi:surface antigen repeat-containing protein [Trichomonas vaginalis G3]|uniref:Surface antigen repeat-containing protein n=1 Tax=Trichomonas vaginalis (strain ATCC PRA-98 / G3) TaxID=412133 RepID=A2FNI2_TRIV3|nr:hypothetical protein TVAGG3_0747440 [Trichomonas vaginalis G3]EAX93520.1 surface antigen repeat-containing protein [Trichomonas vaginalis G3]KAI5512274.1 hypothetical protein TVAGG3_0747440 [Trichomonas vaginalis G3]|eukprot:XP_001306450.1 surface antigen repeat-containing protein [Trichomonas vaginalis G3]